MISRFCFEISRYWTLLAVRSTTDSLDTYLHLLSTANLFVCLTAVRVQLSTEAAHGFPIPRVCLNREIRLEGSNLFFHSNPKVSLAPSVFEIIQNYWSTSTFQKGREGKWRTLRSYFRRDFRVANFGICEVRKTPLKKCSNPHTNIKPRHISTPIIIIELIISLTSKASSRRTNIAKSLYRDAPYKKQEWILTKITNVIDERSKSGGRSVRCVPYGVGVVDVNNM